VNRRLAGLLLFLPVPLVLFLFLRHPLGVRPSLILGLALMLTHPLYARPFALRLAGKRCLWCGCDLSPSGPLPPDGPADPGEAPGRPRPTEDLSLTLREPRGLTTWTACTAHHRRRLMSTLGYAARHRTRLSIGILGTLVLFLCGAALLDAGVSPTLTAADAVAFFQLGVALTVLPLGWFGPHHRGAAEETPRLPFPAHIQALIGTLSVLWLFRLIGLWWLIQGAAHVIGRLRGA
jgi:hypothetical protein